MDDFDDDWELAPENAHPDAAEVLDEPWYWDTRDENSPFGNEIAQEALARYRDAYEEDPQIEGAEFLAELLEGWDVDRDLAEGVPEEELAAALEREHFHILTWDDAAVAVAFAEVVFRGTVSAECAEAATRALEREASAEMIEARGWADPGERRARCDEMIRALRRA